MLLSKNYSFDLSLDLTPSNSVSRLVFEYSKEFFKKKKIQEFFKRCLKRLNNLQRLW